MEVEASLLASESLRKLRSSIRRVVWSRRQLLASVGAVLLSLACWMGLPGVILHLVSYGFNFVCSAGILLFGPRRLVGVTAFWRWLVRVALGMVLSVFFAAEIGFRWDPSSSCLDSAGSASAL